MTNEEILNIEFECMDLNRKITIKNYLKELLSELWIREEGFSGKRPFGNSGWQHDVYKPLIEKGLISGSLDEEGYINECDDKEADSLLLDLIESL